MNKIRIMYLLHSLERGGLEKCVATLVNKINPEIFVPSVCCLSELGMSLSLIEKDNVKIFNMEKGDAHEAFLFLRLARLFKREKIDILHTNGWAALFDGFFGAKIGRVPVVVHTEHGKDVEDFVQIQQRRVWARRLITPFLDQMIAVSDDIKKQFVNVTGLKAEQIVCIHNGIEFHDVEINYKEKRKEIGVKDIEILIGAVGRLESVKNYDVFIQAAELVLKEYPLVKFILIGDGTLKEKLQSLTTKLGIEKSVLLLGERNDVDELLKVMDIFVLPSRSEGLSIALLEAVANKLPIVATNVGGNPEVVIDGKTGILIPSGDVSSLVRAITELLKDEDRRKNMGENGFVVVKEEFTVEKMIANHEELYLSLYKKKCGLCKGESLR